MATVKAEVQAAPGETPDLNFLQTQCREVWWTCKRLPSSKQVAKNDKRDMVSSTEGEVGGFSISKRIFNSKHPAIKAVNEVFRAIDELRDHYTIVKSASVTEISGANFQVDPGKRIIRVTDIQEFESKFFLLKKELEEAVKTVAFCVHNEKVFEPGKPAAPSIVDIDRKQLGKSFNLKDYPTEQELVNLVTVTNPQYGVMQVDKLLPASVLERETKRVTQELGDTMALATNRVIAQITESFDTLIRSLSKKEILAPKPVDDFSKRMVQNHPVEVVNVMETRHDRTIPAGQLRVELTWREASESGEVRKVTETVLLDKSYFEETLCPQKTDSRRQLRGKSIENVQQIFGWLQQIQPMLGENGAKIQTSLEGVRKVLQTLASSGSASDVLEEVKKSNFAAESLSGALKAAVSEMLTQADEVVKRQVSARRAFSF